MIIIELSDINHSGIIVCLEQEKWTRLRKYQKCQIYPDESLFLLLYFTSFVNYQHWIKILASSISDFWEFHMILNSLYIMAEWILFPY